MVDDGLIHRSLYCKKLNNCGIMVCITRSVSDEDKCIDERFKCLNCGIEVVAHIDCSELFE